MSARFVDFASPPCTTRVALSGMMKRIVFAMAALLTAIPLSAADPTASDALLVPYPTDYRAWAHLGSVFGWPNEQNKATAPHGMVHHLYANEKALTGLRTGVYPEGAMFVADWFILKEKYSGSFDEGARDRTDVMIKDARFATTGGWGYDEFAQDSKVIRVVGPVAPNACFNCHAKVKARDYVFSALRP